MRQWFFVALAATSIACSGGRDSVQTIGGDREYAGPGASDPAGEGGDFINGTTSVSPLVALCTMRCAHVRAADCEGAPKHETDACEGLCVQEVSAIPATCDDESAAVYACELEAKVTCTGTIDDQPEISGCDSEKSDLHECAVPGSDCMASPPSADLCLSIGFPIALFCNEGIEAPPNCVEFGSGIFCCS
jgi:hypothetical protein